MRNPLTRRLTQALLGAWLVLSCAACGKKDDGDRYKPPEDAARRALEAALMSWSHGGSPGQIAAAAPAVQAVDSQWSDGQKLEEFQIVGVETNEEARLFVVDLRLQGARDRQTVRYFVVGRDPIWVYREEDYQRPDGM
jgi:hypothetical protein